MANVKLVFSGTEKSQTDDYQLECFHNAGNEITITIENHLHPCSFISLDKSTAIKLHKELKKQISCIQPENENTNE